MCYCTHAQFYHVLQMACVVFMINPSNHSWVVVKIRTTFWRWGGIFPIYYGNSWESWWIWCEQGRMATVWRTVNTFFLANGIDDAEKKRAVLLSVIGPVTYKLLRSLLVPAKPGEKTYSELVAALSAHYSPPPFLK